MIKVNNNSADFITDNFNIKKYRFLVNILQVELDTVKDKMVLFAIV